MILSVVIGHGYRNAVPTLVVTDLPVDARWEAYAFSPTTFTLNNEDSMADWGTCSAAVYPSTTNRTPVAGVALTVATVDVNQKTISITAADMTDLLGAEEVKATYWWEFTRASDGKIILAGELISTTKVC